MNASITTKENSLSHKTKPSDYCQIIEKKSNLSSDDLSSKIAHLSDSINKIYHQPYITLDETLKSSNTNSTLSKLYQLFLSLRDNKDHLLNENIFNDLIIKKTEGLITKLNQTSIHSMNFIQFTKQIQLIAKENQLSQDYLYKKILHPKFFINDQNQNNNAIDSSTISDNFLLTEYNNDLSRLKYYFIRHSNSYYQMTCSTFIQCISKDLKLNKIEDRLQLNGIFYQIQSLLINESVYTPERYTSRKVNMNYTTLIENDRTPRHSLASIDPTTHIQLSEFGLNKDLCQTCRHRLFKKQEIEHKPIDCLTQRCESLEAEVTRLKDHDMKSRIYIKDLENKISALEDAMQALTAPKQQQATPYKIGTVNKIRPQLQKSQSSEDVPDNEKPEINYDNVLQPRRASQNRVGLFGSLGASSQHRHSLKP